MPPASGHQVRATPRFYVMPPQRFSPGVVLLAVLCAFACVPPVLYALRHARASGYAASAGLSDNDDDDNEDPSSRVDTIYLGDPGDAPVATRPARHPSTVHPFVVIKLPRSGDALGQLPDSPAGHLLYDWLAAFNSKDPSLSGKALPHPEIGVAEVQLALRQQTGGFTLLSAREVQPGILVFRMQDQTPEATQVLGTLQVHPNARPATIASFSLRAIPQPPAKPLVAASPPH